MIVPADIMDNIILYVHVSYPRTRIILSTLIRPYIRNSAKVSIHEIRPFHLPSRLQTTEMVALGSGLTASPTGSSSTEHFFFLDRCCKLRRGPCSGTPLLYSNVFIALAVPTVIANLWAWHAVSAFFGRLRPFCYQNVYLDLYLAS